MGELWAASLAFVLTHLIPALRPLRAFLIRSMGKPLYIGLYSAISLAVIAWLGIAYAHAPYVELWPPAPWARWLPVLVMPVACLLLVAALTSPNPLSVTATARPFDERRPGIVSVTRHPLMVGLGLWSLAHIPPNGDGASVVLFGLLLALSAGGMISADVKAKARLGEEAWRALTRKKHIDWRGIGAWRFAAGIGLYGVLVFLHPVVIGVSPLP